MWTQDQKGVAGKISTDSLKPVLDELKSIIGGNENADKLLKLFESAYTENKNLADATRFFVHQLFSKYGLVIIDGDDKKLKASFAEIMKDDLGNNSAYKIINETIKKLETKH